MTLSPQRVEKAAEAVRSWGVQASDSPFNFTAEESDAIARAAISAYLGDTHVDVPREPTLEQMSAAGKAVSSFKERMNKMGGAVPATDYALRAVIYRAMLSAELTERDAG